MSAVVVILLMFCAVIAMVKKLDTDRKKHALLRPRDSSETEA